MILFNFLILGVEIGALDSTEKAIFTYKYKCSTVFDSNVRRPRSAATLEIPVSNEVMGKWGRLSEGGDKVLEAERMKE